MPRDIYDGQDYPRVNPTVRERGACRGMPLDLFFPDSNDNACAKKLKAARSVCVGCPVRAECLAEALQVTPNRDYGIWGGTSKKERARMRHQQTKPARAAA